MLLAATQAVPPGIDEWLLGFVTEWGSAGAVVAVVWMFIRSSKERDKQSAESQERRDNQLLMYMQSRDEALSTTLLAMSTDCHAVQTRATDALDRNTEAWAGAREALNANTSTVKSAAEIIDRHRRSLAGEHT